MLNDSRIRYFCENHNLITPFDSKYLQPHSIDLRLGGNFKVPLPPTHSWVQNKGEYEDIDVEVGSQIVIKPMQFILAHTEEIVNVPLNLVGITCGKSTIARNGLQIEAAGLLDAGFHGQITLELFNMNVWDLYLTVGMPICQAYFESVDEPQEKFYGKIGHYNGQRGAKPPVFHL